MSVCFHGLKSLVQLFLDHSSSKNIDLNVQDNDGMTAIMEACQNGDIDVVKLLLSHPEIELNKTDKDGNTAFHLALLHGHSDIVELFCDQDESESE